MRHQPLLLQRVQNALAASQRQRQALCNLGGARSVARQQRAVNTFFNRTEPQRSKGARPLGNGRISFHSENLIPLSARKSNGIHIANFGVALIGVLREQFTVGLIGILERDSVLAWALESAETTSSQGAARGKKLPAGC